MREIAFMEPSFELKMKEIRLTAPSDESELQQLAKMT